MSFRVALMVSGFVAFKKNSAAAAPALKRFLPMRRSKSRIAIDTLPKSISTGQGVRHLWADGAMIGDIGEVVPMLDRHAAARLFLVEERLDQQRGREDFI